MVDGHIKIGDCLCLNTLSSIHHKQGSLAGSNRTAYLVGEVDVSRSINKIKDIFLAIVHIFHLDGMTLDGDATFTLQVHVIKHLSFGDLDGVGEFQHTVG